MGSIKETSVEDAFVTAGEHSHATPVINFVAYVTKRLSCAYTLLGTTRMERDLECQATVLRVRVNADVERVVHAVTGLAC